MPFNDSLYLRPHLHADDLVNSPFYAWLLANPDWIAATVLLIAFVESFAIIGILVPGVFLLYVAAFLAGTGLLTLPMTLLTAFLGAVLGDGLSFLLGWRYKNEVRKWPVLRDNTQWMDRGEQFILAHGTKSIVAGRFIGPIRPLTPLIAGTLSMPPARFFSINVLSAIAWAPVYILPGYALGAAIDLPFSRLELSLIAIACITVLAVSFYYLRRWFNLSR